MSSLLLSSGGELKEGDILPAQSVSAASARNQLKICYIAETVHAGVGRHILDTACAFSERGHEIHLLYSPIRADPSFLAQIAEQKNVYCTAVPMPRAIGRGDIAAFRRIRKYVEANGPFDVIHGQSSKGGGYARLLRLFGHGPVFYTPHAFITLSPVIGSGARLVYGVIESILSRLTDCVICVSMFERGHARRLGIAKGRLANIFIGADAFDAAPRDTIRAEMGIAPDEVAIGYVGRMDDQKAPERVIAAARELLPVRPKLVFVMVGDGPKRKFLEEGMVMAGFGDRMRWLGFEKARHYMAGFDILVLPSHYEGFARVLVEALQAGLPIVSTPVGGTHETVEPGVNGFIVPHGDAAHMADSIRRLADDEVLRLRMSEASRRRGDHFTTPRMIDAIEDLYLQVCGRRSATPGAVSLATTRTASA
jgi:glycosyltransferase involved in cell wall biosynthesis